MRYGSVPSSWLAAFNTWDARALLDLLNTVNERGIDPNDLPKVREVADELWS
jgi:hypothetical protein